MGTDNSGEGERERGPDDERFALAYAELRRLAERYLGRERAGHTLQPTALLHEAYLKLGRGGEGSLWRDQSHFIGCAARAMRQVLVDHARRALAEKRHGERVDLTLSSFPNPTVLDPDEVLALDQALAKLARQPPNGARQARLIELVWLGGLDMTAAAAELGVSRRQAHRDWAWARVWLAREMRRE